jgi:hypothetical protein
LDLGWNRGRLHLLQIRCALDVSDDRVLTALRADLLKDRDGYDEPALKNLENVETADSRK